jgi:hypothetical protein
MKNREQIEKQLNIIAENLKHFINLPRTSETQKGIDYYMGYRDALQWILKE